MKYGKHILVSLFVLVAVVVALLGVIAFRHNQVSERYDSEASRYIDEFIEDLVSDWSPDAITRLLPTQMLAQADSVSLQHFIDIVQSLGEFKGNSPPRMTSSDMKLTRSGFRYRADYWTNCTFEHGQAGLHLRLVRVDDDFVLAGFWLTPRED